MRRLLLLALSSLAVSTAQPLVLHGTFPAADAPGYRLLRFEVPAGTRRLDVKLTKPPEGVMATLGLYGPLGYRGMGKAEFTVAAADASAPFLPGPIEPGSWQVLLYAYQVPAEGWQYQVEVALATSPEPAPTAALRSGPTWFVGDLHAHTGHSDGGCPAQSGKLVPCPPFRLVEAAAREGLDFLAITDHNTNSALQDLRLLQPVFDRLLLIHGREITTPKGHANLWGTAAETDFRIGRSGYAVNAFLDAAHAAGGLVSINHPHWPISAACPGCGWGWKPETDFARIDAIEVVNGYRQENARFVAPPGNGVPFWEEQLRQGHRPTAVGGSDDHLSGSALPRSGVGRPRVEVLAAELSERAILSAVRAGHVYVLAEGAASPKLRVEVRRAGAPAALPGDNLSLPAAATLPVHLSAAGGARLRLLLDGVELHAWPISGAAEWDVPIEIPAGRHWLRAEILDAHGSLLTLSNPVYFNFGRR